MTRKTVKARHRVKDRLCLSRVGSYTMMYFGFTRCPDICPAELLKIGDVLALLDAADCDEFEADPIALRPRDQPRSLQRYF